MNVTDARQFVDTNAVRMGCQTVWSEDLNSGQTYDQVMVVNPF